MHGQRHKSGTLGAIIRGGAVLPCFRTSIVAIATATAAIYAVLALIHIIVGCAEQGPRGLLSPPSSAGWMEARSQSSMSINLCMRDDGAFRFRGERLERDCRLRNMVSGK